MRCEVLWVLPEAEKPVLVIPLPGGYERCALRTADELAIFFNHVTAEAGVRLVGHPAERRFELRDLREIERADFDPRILVVFRKIIGDGVGLRLGDHRMLRR